MVLIEEKQPLHFLSPMCKMYSKSVYYFNDVTLSWIWKIFCLDKTHLYWFSDYLLLLLTVFKYRINSWSISLDQWSNILRRVDTLQFRKWVATVTVKNGRLGLLLFRDWATAEDGFSYAPCTRARLN